MKKVTSLALASAMAIAAASGAYAGGPVIVEDEPEPIVAPATGSSVGAMPILAGVAAAAIIWAIADDDDDDDDDDSSSAHHD
ncbi:hypothetical protein C8N32_10117 [Rhodovulum imhoffii]|uniref:Ferrochelatase n=1 Tax=Rhodovulum imhoffii TaxID=365340 RepID=A0A2T5BW13_9RHOB|nr:hypothetical protein [Rhodovulum imhoffii]MBK5933544.1 hypothetical protein [Rhodovulum imhoffii]PTN03824.1 hypothetical protein C8N32_10117 [Rhodovulum imhoffii]